MRYKIIFAYDGSNYLGSQRQVNAPTIEFEINKALSIMHKKDITIVTSGRTDKGVHALAQTAHFDSFLDIEEKRFVRAINSLLPLDIRIKEINKVSSNFHARHQAIKKKYIYIITNEYNIFKRNYETFIKKELNVKIMSEAIKLFVGTHDFFGFASYVKDKPTVKTIYEANLEEIDGKIVITFVGDNFLRYMVRRMVGTLIEIGAGKKNIDVIQEILQKRDKSLCGKTAEPNGLYLKEVFY